MSRHRHKVAAAERDQRRRDVQAKLAAAAGVDVSDPRCEALSWLLLSLDVAKERLLSGVFVDLSAWQVLVDQMQALLPKPPQNTLNIRWTESIGHCAKCKAVSTAEEYAAYEALLDRRVDDEVTKRLQAIPQPVAKVEQSAPTPAAESPATPTPLPPSNITPLRARPPMGTSAYVAAINDAAFGASPFDPPRGATRSDNNG